jgi:catechol 1,2-dioxygenase
VGDCDTTNDFLGPFYRANAPTRSDLTFENLTGMVVELKGKVFITPIENALVEI